MIIEYHGHSEFLLTSESGIRVLTDPYDGHVGYPMREYAAEAVTLSHDHGDHAFFQKAGKNACVVRDGAPITVGADVSIYGVPTFHDDAQGSKRGGNLVFVYEINGVRIAHLGDLGHPLSEEQRKAIGRVDVLLVPVGGFYTIDAAQAAQVVSVLAPRVTIPMHYRTSVNAAWPIAPVESFLELENALNTSCLPLLRVTLGDLNQQPTLAVLNW